MLISWANDPIGGGKFAARESKDLGVLLRCPPFPFPFIALSPNSLKPIIFLRVLQFTFYQRIIAETLADFVFFEGKIHKGSSKRDIIGIIKSTVEMNLGQHDFLVAL